MTRNALKSPRRLRVRGPWVLAGLLAGLVCGWASTQRERSRGGAPAAVSETTGRAGAGAGGAVPGGPGSGEDTVPNGGSIAGQIGGITSFMDAYARDPGALPYLLAELNLPAEWRRDVVTMAVCRDALKNPHAVLAGIEALPLRTQRSPLVVKAVAAWATESGTEARAWVREHAYPEALGVVGAGMWMRDPGAAMTALRESTPERRSPFITSVVYSDARWTEAQGRELHQMIIAGRDRGDQSAAATEPEFLRRHAEVDPDYVLSYLEQRGATGLNEHVIADVALGKNPGDWRAASDWLSTYQSGAVTPASRSLWERWLEADIASVQACLAARGPAAAEMSAHFLTLSPGTPAQQELARWITENTAARK